MAPGASTGGGRVVATILAYGGGGEYEDALRSLLEGGIPPADVIVAHNPARPGEAPPGVPPGVELIQAPQNLGYTGGMNLALESLLRRDCEYVLVLSHDARLHPGALGALVEAAGRNPTFGALGPVLVHAGSDRPFSVGGFTRGNGSNGHLVALPPGVAGEISPCDWIDGGTMLIRTAVLRRAGLFDERFFAYFEEADLCLRIRRLGAGVGVVLAARADQDPGGSKRPGAWAYLNTRNGIAFARRVAGPRGLAWLTLRSAWIALTLTARVVVRRLEGRPAAEQRAMAVGTARGIVDHYRGRWGAPPPDLPGIGDVANA